ncbi:MAG: TonB-dependent receptor, partial [Gammaproteobacteria bacterium]|nr:TonB-dependent receptor [Gammaproteobacteria bacterium]
TERDSERREFQIIAPSSFESGVGMLRPDYLLGGAIIDYYKIGLIESTETDPAFAAALKTHAAYAQLQAEIVEGLEVNVGARMEKAEQRVNPVQVFRTASNSGAGTNLENDYLLPALTVTYKFGDNMQVRANASKTIARPQFRELMFQAYYDPESNRCWSIANSPTASCVGSGTSPGSSGFRLRRSGKRSIARSRRSRVSTTTAP